MARNFVRVALLGLLPAITLAAGDASSAGPEGFAWKLDPALRARQMLRRSTNDLVPLYVQTRDAERTRALIHGLGGTTGALAGNILTARVPERALTKLAGSSDAMRLEGARPIGGKLDKVLELMKVNPVHAGDAGSPFKGTGVVVGIVDFGLDFTHAAFKKADGASRLVGLWDHGAQGKPPAGQEYGSECDAASLSSGSCGHKTTDPHGTHVTGVAAGAPVGGQYSGVAPEADIVFVSVGKFPPGITDPYEAISTALCDATAYVFNVARMAGKPAVVNLSLGEHSGPHDGSSLADQCLDSLAGPGRIIVAAAGNEALGGSSVTSTKERVALHAQMTASATPTTVGFLGSERGGVDASVWFDAPSDVTIRIGAKPAAGGDTVFTPSAKIDADASLNPLTVGGKAVGPVIIGSGTTASGARGFDIRVDDENGDKAELNDVTWILEVTGSGKVDAFIDTTFHGGFRPGEKSDGVVVDNEISIGYPAIAKDVLAVGSFVSKPEWTPLDASVGKQKRIDLATGQDVAFGAISSFSSHGPPRSGAVIKGPKPDIVAPGETVVSALHNSVAVSAADRIKAPPDGYYVAAGTSIAAPAVAGAVALMLQKNPKLTVSQIRGVLDATAVAPPGVTAPSPVWGRGQLDVLAALKATPKEGEVGPGETSSSSGADGPPADGSSSGDDDGCSMSSPAQSSPGWLFLGLALFLGAWRRRERT